MVVPTKTVLFTLVNTAAWTKHADGFDANNKHRNTRDGFLLHMGSKVRFCWHVYAVYIYIQIIYTYT